MSQLFDWLMQNHTGSYAGLAQLPEGKVLLIELASSPEGQHYAVMGWNKEELRIAHVLAPPLTSDQDRKVAWEFHEEDWYYDRPGGWGIWNCADPSDHWGTDWGVCAFQHAFKFVTGQIERVGVEGDADG